MELTPVNVINQIVAWFAVTILEMIFIIDNVPYWKSVIPKWIAGNAAGIIFVLLYFPYYDLAKFTASRQLETVMIYIWWIVFYFLTILLMRWWFGLSIGQTMVRCIMGICLFAIGNAVIQNFILGLWFPELAEKDTMLYLLLYTACYFLLGATGYFFFARNMRLVENLYGIDSPMVCGFLSILLIFANIVWDISNGIFKHGIEPLMLTDKYNTIVSTVQYFCAFTSVVFSLFVLGILFLFYRITYLRQEENMLQYLQNEKEKQYEYSKQNMEVINQKCHDLKRQIQALRFSRDEEKEKLYQETQSAADFFDYVVKTDNEILNTILTEKGLICHNKRIRLTCTVNGGDFNRISVIDLYTIFSNALDNAIECVEKYEEEKKIIAVNISQIGKMNCIMIENYFDGELIFQNGQLLTSKEDTYYHGFGVRSIQMLSKKYKGDMRISHTNHTFSLQIMLPA
ncbi:ATP-binding protein [Marvinbryantia formatexigens]|nr:sensor histidine kinase [Marvinbryantia formatexigens]UWO23734.1 GHKL domain-containing protein [Marvinbryantia formatexigens DSM 14469]SDF68584.1 Sensor histidine kinase YesM [Marvinbryantia formatexigens]